MKSIVCKVFVKNSDIPSFLKEFEKFDNKVTCTYANPEKFAERR